MAYYKVGVLVPAEVVEEGADDVELYVDIALDDTWDEEWDYYQFGTAERLMTVFEATSPLCDVDTDDEDWYAFVTPSSEWDTSTLLVELVDNYPDMWIVTVACHY